MRKPNPSAIKATRELKAIGQRELGRRIGKSSGYMARVEQGDCTPSPQALASIATELSVSIEDISDDVQEAA